MDKKISNLMKCINEKDKELLLIRKDEVVHWVYDDTSFLSHSKKRTKKEMKEREDKWGKKRLRKCREDLNPKKQWTNLYGEYLCKDVYILLGKKIWKPEKKEGMCPDWETEDEIIEVKTGTYYTDGTAHEKILGTPLKYSNVPRLYGKPLKIVCIGGAEKRCREEYKILGDSIPEEKKKILDFYKSMKIEFVGITDLLNKII